jgi:hypothetical protein
MLRCVLAGARPVPSVFRRCHESAKLSQVLQSSSSPLIRSTARAEAELSESMTLASQAVRVASVVDSDDVERNQAVELSRRAFLEYDKLLQRTKENTAEQTRLEAKFGSDIAGLKQELYDSRKQRVWMAVHGWF